MDTGWCEDEAEQQDALQPDEGICSRSSFEVFSLSYLHSCYVLDVKHVVLQVLLYPGALAGGGGQRFEAMVKRGGPLGELVQWADLSACLIILGHNVTFTSTQHQLYRLPPLQLLLHLHI